MRPILRHQPGGRTGVLSAVFFLVWGASPFAASRSGKHCLAALFSEGRTGVLTLLECLAGTTFSLRGTGFGRCVRYCVISRANVREYCPPSSSWSGSYCPSRQAARANIAWPRYSRRVVQESLRSHPVLPDAPCIRIIQGCNPPRMPCRNDVFPSRDGLWTMRPILRHQPGGRTGALSAVFSLVWVVSPFAAFSTNRQRSLPESVPLILS